MLIDKQVTEIEKLSKKIVRINAAVKSTIRKQKKSSAVVSVTEGLLVIDGESSKLKTNSKTIKQSPTRTRTKANPNKK